jgi:hypothetical protein
MFIMETIQDYTNEDLLSFLIFKDNDNNNTSVNKFNGGNNAKNNLQEIQFSIFRLFMTRFNSIFNNENMI